MFPIVLNKKDKVVLALTCDFDVQLQKKNGLEMIKRVSAGELCSWRNDTFLEQSYGTVIA